MTLLEDFFEALRFLTIFPLTPTLSQEERENRKSSFPSPSGRGQGEGALARAMIFFPLVGFVIGLIALSFYNVLKNFFPESIAILALVFLPILLSGGLHADGFADFCDGFFGGRSREEILRIMKDSRIGAFGGLGLIFLILTKYELLKVLPYPPVFFLLALAAGRWAQVVLSFYLPYAGLEGGLGALTASQVKPRELLGSAAFLGLIILWGGFSALMAFLSLLPFLAALAFYFKKKIGGVTGDLMGAASEMTELFILAAGVLMQGGAQ